MNKKLEQSAHIYVWASTKQKLYPSGAVAARDKARGRLHIQNEALRYAADFLEEWTRLLLDGGAQHRKCKAAIAQLREIVSDAEQVLKK